MLSASDSAGGDPPKTALGAACVGARRGLRSDVQRLIEALETGELLVPLSRSIDGVPQGERVELDHDLTLAPHLLDDGEGRLLCALFSDAAVLERVGAAARWRTGSGPLEYCTLPARVALEMVLDLVDGEQIVGVAIDAGHAAELLLRRHEIASIAQRRALPLVGYVARIPAEADAGVLTAEPAEPPDPALLQAIERCLGGVAGIAGWTLRFTFDAERDLEPHPTLYLRPSGEALDRDELGRRLGEALEGKLPEPGYVDILFEP